jgi:hypothetical protein
MRRANIALLLSLAISAGASQRAVTACTCRPQRHLSIGPVCTWVLRPVTQTGSTPLTISLVPVQYNSFNFPTFNTPYFHDNSTRFG